MNRNTLRRRLEWEDGVPVATITYEDGSRGEVHGTRADELDQIKKFDYATINGSTEISYIGTATQDTLSSDAAWTIKRLSYVLIGGDNFLEEIQEISGAIWDDRNTLAWT
jgi:hypothetical protein